MLPVPELKPNEEPFTPDALYPTHPLLKAGTHTLAFPKTAAAAAITPEKPETQKNEDTHARILDHALVKGAITALHIEDDEETGKLRAYTQTQICDIVPDYVKFVAAQKDKYAHLLKTNTQRHFFQQAAAAYFTHAPERACILRDAAIKQFQKETIERQNEEFLARALRPENLLNDPLQTQYRNMILHNLELLMETNAAPDAPDAGERQQTLDAASRDMYIKIMDKRLAALPDSLSSLLDSPAAKRVFSQDELRTYRETMKRAITSQRLSEKALAWIHDEIPPAEAKSLAHSQRLDESEEKSLLALYTQHRHTLHRKRFLQILLDLDNAWRALKKADYNPAAIPFWVKNGDPLFQDCITHTIAMHERHGGLHPAPEYTTLIEFTENFDPRAAAERLADAKNLYSLVNRLGGPDSPAFLAVLRLLLGTSTQADRNWFASLSLAHSEYRAAGTAGNESATGDQINSFLGMFDECRRQKLLRDDREELDPLEIRGLIRECLAASI